MADLKVNFQSDQVTTWSNKQIRTSAPVNDDHQSYNSHMNWFEFGDESVRKSTVLTGECSTVSSVEAAPLLALLIDTWRYLNRTLTV